MHYDNQYTAQYMAGESDRQVRELEYQLAKLTKEKEMLASKLANKNFTENAPKDLVDSQKERLSTLSSELENLNHQMSELKKLI